MPSHAMASRPCAQRKDKGSSRRKRRAPVWPESSIKPPLTPAKPTPPRPEGPEHPRFKRDVVTSIQPLPQTFMSSCPPPTGKAVSKSCASEKPSGRKGGDHVSGTSSSGSGIFTAERPDSNVKTCIVREAHSHTHHRLKSLGSVRETEHFVR